MLPDFVSLQNCFFLIMFSEGIYLQCFARVQPGEKVVSMPPTEDGHGEEEKFITLKLDFESFQKSPVWTDDFTVSFEVLDMNIKLLQ